MVGGFAPGLVSLNGSIKDQALIDAAVEAGARITLDSAAELDRVIDAATRTGRRAAVRLRARPDYTGLDLPTDFVEDALPMSEAARRYKAGIPTSDLLEAGRRALAEPAIELRGLMVHLPRHRTEVAVWATAAERFVDVVARRARRGTAGGRRSSTSAAGCRARAIPTGGLVERRADGGTRARRARPRPTPRAIGGALGRPGSGDMGSTPAASPSRSSRDARCSRTPGSTSRPSGT